MDEGCSAGDSCEMKDILDAGYPLYHGNFLWDSTYTSVNEYALTWTWNGSQWLPIRWVNYRNSTAGTYERAI